MVNSMAKNFIVLIILALSLALLLPTQTQAEPQTKLPVKALGNIAPIPAPNEAQKILQEFRNNSSVTNDSQVMSVIVISYYGGNGHSKGLFNDFSERSFDRIMSPFIPSDNSSMKSATEESKWL